ncbi:MAG: hypothetical protein H0W59_10300 [Chloroflexia bacterium]|nr:hypothetical protein [Chloroflexia bacterium]
MRRWLRDHSLTLTMLGLFAIFFIGQTITGMRSYNQDQIDHGETPVAYSSYLRSGHFVEATFENWESEFLQMGLYVLLTVFLFQRGSSESKDPDAKEPVDDDPSAERDRPDAPWPVRQGGFALALYQHSLTIALLLLFAVSFIFHAMGGARHFSAEQIAHGGEAVSTLAFLQTAQFWFESFQNWQSEFLSVGVLVILSVYLRQRGSPESKPVAAPHSATGSG